MIKVEPKGGDPLPQAPLLWAPTVCQLRFALWNAGERLVEVEGLDDDRVERTSCDNADVVVDTPGWPGALRSTQPQHALAPNAVWVSVTPFGLDGPGRIGLRQTSA